MAERTTARPPIPDGALLVARAAAIVVAGAVAGFAVNAARGERGLSVRAFSPPAMCVGPLRRVQGQGEGAQAMIGALRLLLRFGLGGLLLFAGVAKLRDPSGFATEISNYHLLPSLAPWLAVALPTVELAIGGALLTGT